MDAAGSRWVLHRSRAPSLKNSISFLKGDVIGSLVLFPLALLVLPSIAYGPLRVSFLFLAEVRLTPPGSASSSVGDDTFVFEVPNWVSSRRRTTWAT